MKAITEQQKLEAFALYTMANQHYDKCREFERAVSAILGPTDGLGEYNDSVSDAIYSNEPGRALPFEDVLRAARVKVRPAKKSKQR